MDASRMVERCKEAQEHTPPEIEDTSLLALLQSQGLRCRKDEIPSDQWDKTSITPEREVREIIPLDDPPYMDSECYGV